MDDSNDISRLFKDLYRYAARMLGRTDLAEEVAQEALTRLAGGGRVLEGEAARRWLFVVARNLCLSQLRHQTRHPEVPLDEGAAFAAADPDPAAAALAGERRRLVAEAVAALPPAMREVIILREYEEMDYAQIAEVIGCQIGTVKSRLARAREELRQRLAVFR